MKLLFKGISLLLILLFSSTSFSQSVIPELIFQNPVLISGTAGQDEAVYKFSNVATDIDATVQIKARSGSSVILTNIDIANLGFNNAFQPQLGIAGNVPSYQSWWMEFEMKFYKAGTVDKQNITKFYVTSLDVDGDGASIQEFVQMEKIKNISYSSVTYLQEVPLISTSNNVITELGSNSVGSSKRILGPVQNFIDIDIAATQVMATYEFEDKDKISFIIGAKSGAVVSNAGERLNSLWFKQFSLAPPQILPVKLNNFTALYDKKNVTLNWSTAMETNFSHYVVERSIDGKHYSEIALVFANGNTNKTSDYQFKDLNVMAANNIVYYRIRFVEASKESYYSKVQIIRLSKGLETIELNTFPNPVLDVLKVTLPYTWQSKTVVLEIFNASGIKLKTEEFKSAGQTEMIQFSQFSKGFYIIKATCEAGTIQQRVIKN